MIVSLASGAVLALGVLLALSQLGFQVGPMLAGLGIAGFILGFALQETLANFAAGIMILAYQPYDVGDLIDCAGGVYGTVSRMNLVSTTILTLDNQTRIVPNGKIWGDVITNLTAQRLRRVDLVFGISYTDDIDKTQDVPWVPGLPWALHCARAAGYTFGPMSAQWPHRWPKDSENRAANR